MNDKFTLAFKLMTLGYSVIPSGGGDKGKSPLVPWQEWQEKIPDENQLQDWETTLHPVLWGIVTNDRIAVIDGDTPEIRAELEANLGQPHVATPRGGGHWYINTRGHPMKTMAGLLPGVDVRGVGGFVNIVGAKYRILQPPVPGTLIPWEKLPEKILAALKNDGKSRPKAKDGKPITEGQRNARLARLAGAMRRQGAAPAAIEAALLAINTQQCRPPLSEHEVSTIASSIGRYEPGADQSSQTSETKVSEVHIPGFILPDGTIGEMVIDEGRRCFILKIPGGTISRVGEYATGSRVFKPMADHLAGGTVSFASDAAEYGSLGDLLGEVRSFIRRYVELPANFEAISALYVLLSWVYDSLPSVPYLRALGDYGTGKTRFLEAIGAIAFRAINASGATTPSPIFRILDLYAGTLILDEADFSQSDSMAEIIKILNSGYKPGSPVLRAEPTGGKKWIPCSYKVFGPKILATRKRWADKALESRCLTWESEGLTREEVPVVLGPRFHGEAAALRCKLLSFRLDYLPRVSAFNLEDATPVGSLEPRLQEILLPLRALAEGDTALEATLSEFVGNMQAELEEERRSSLPALVLGAILAIREEEGELSAKIIADRLNGEGLVQDHLERPEKGITSRQVGAIVNNLGLKTRKATGSRRAVIRWETVIAW
ncbi:MAG: hypothetical protein DDT30_00847 [Dehalococcoidia bacterium]|nr:hypothetical protein [Bacillota bacterium]